MIGLKYGYVVEDEAQAIFLENILPQIINYLNLGYSFTFLKDEKYFESSLVTIATDRNKFEQTYVNLAENGLIDYQQDIFIIGRDVDHKDFVKLQEKFNEIILTIRKKGLDTQKTIIMLPMQCLEYWLRYEKLNRNPQNLTSPQMIDNQRKKTIKQNIYGTSNPPEKRKIIVEELSQNMNIVFLYNNSQSFAHFVDQLQTFLNRHTLISKS